MCKSKAEGGMRCAAHTRPAFTAAMRERLSGGGDDLTLSRAAEAYAATPSGQKVVRAEIASLEEIRDVHTAALLRSAADTGQRHLDAAKEATAAIENETARAAAHAWAGNLPTERRALDEYFAMAASEVGVEPSDIELRFESFRAAAEAGELDAAPDLDQCRYVTADEDAPRAGTPTDPASLRALAELEAMAADIRRERRARVETVDDEGTRWVKYENEDLSEVLRTVGYDPATRTARIALVPHTGTAERLYVYRDVHPSLIKTMVSARSMGRFYSLVFSGAPADSLGDRSVRHFSFAAHAANGLVPFTRSTGPVPRKYLRSGAGRPAAA